ncbi:hypothetical protein T261_6082 [Streptomyces lydicus]|nr:hypothetical protein T261_6082 [Streptomyces lydicus]
MKSRQYRRDDHHHRRHSRTREQLPRDALTSPRARSARYAHRRVTS